jgi:hypothetical protein
MIPHIRRLRHSRFAGRSLPAVNWPNLLYDIELAVIGGLPANQNFDSGRGWSWVPRFGDSVPRCYAARLSTAMSAAGGHSNDAGG